ncbi:MAG: hypothetical protein ACRCWQ_14725 [Bacilli bacterium]
MNASTKAPKKIDLSTLTDDQTAALEKSIADAIAVHVELDLIRGSLKDVKDMMKEETGVPVKQFNQLVAMRRQNNRDEIEEQNEEVLELYDRLYNKTKVVTQS